MDRTHRRGAFADSCGYSLGGAGADVADRGQPGMARLERKGSGFGRQLPVTVVRNGAFVDLIATPVELVVEPAGN